MSAGAPRLSCRARLAVLAVLAVLSWAAVIAAVLGILFLAGAMQP